MPRKVKPTQSDAEFRARVQELRLDLDEIAPKVGAPRQLTDRQRSEIRAELAELKR
jgi:hypothetical protein